ncbi:hypothetical protein AZI85_17065 [Bdellovibrio bacteriovorus]|uniref:Uncharacterized protein n=1 Tax=Bdellovibrio bacteriovorus TaxID=959 RepID=A0A150WT69_BDEBC|nr:TolC family protein [Bdellovibrio bacteriovorus]KYG67591.1 hypothetical protein AZI85_17065 [Bdellovibrio bacteriovorus]
MKLQKYFLILILGGIWSTAQGAETISFEKIEELIKAKNPVVEAMQQKAEAKKAREGSLARSFLPDVSAEISQENFKLGSEVQDTQSSWRVEASVNLYRGGSDLKEEQVRELETKSAISDERRVFQDELQRAYEVYWLLVFKMEVKNSLETHLALSQKNLNEANRRINSGVATSTDRLEFQMKMSLIRQEISMVEKDIRSLSKRLGIALGKNEAVLPQGPFQHVHDWEINIQPLKIADMAHVRKARTEVEISEARKSQLKAGYLPELDLYAGFSEPNQRDERDIPSASERRESYVGVKASWSLGKAIDSRIERGSLQKETAAKAKELDFLIKQSEIDQESVLDGLKTLHSFVHDAEENIKASQSYLNATLKEYGRGVKNSPDVMEATEKYIEAKKRYAEINRDFNTLYSSQLALHSQK